MAKETKKKATNAVSEDDVKKLKASVAGLKGAITVKNKEIDALSKLCKALREQVDALTKGKELIRENVELYNSLPWYARAMNKVVLPN